jgi:hypothetical protein
LRCDRATLSVAHGRGRRERSEGVNPGYWWLLIGIIGGLLPAYLLVRTLMHVLNIPGPDRRRDRS